MSGFRNGFPIRDVEDGVAAVLIGSGASVLDFDFSTLESSITLDIAMNDAIFLPTKPKFHSYEHTTNSKYSEAVSARHDEILSDADLSLICRLPMNLHELGRYPDSFQRNQGKVHLFASVTAREGNRFERQFRRYLHGKTKVGLPGPDPGFSLGRLIVRLLKHEVRDIRLLGVDLFSPDYFWEQLEDYSWLADIKSNPKRLVHHTNETWRPWTAVSFLEVLLELQDEFGFSIKTQKSSGTARFIDSFD